MLVIVRNPLDVIISFANLMLLQSHTLEPYEPYYEQFTDWWDDWIRKIAKEMASNNDFII